MLQIFKEKYIKMNKSVKISSYPRQISDSFANVLVPIEFEPECNYTNEYLFKKLLINNHCITKYLSMEDLFYLPLSIPRLRHCPRERINEIQYIIKEYIYNINYKYPY